MQKKKHSKANCYAYIKNDVVAITKKISSKDEIVITILKTDFENCWWNK